jgi:hypothetical protein
MSVLNRDIAKRIAATLKRALSSNFDGEVCASIEGLKRVLDGAGLTLHDLATVIEIYGESEMPDIEQRKHTDAEAEKYFNRGVEKGRKEYSGRALSVDYFDDDGEPRCMEITRYCLNHPGKARLKPTKQEFIDTFEAKTRWRGPTAPMIGFLLMIFWELRESLK